MTTGYLTAFQNVKPVYERKSTFFVNIRPFPVKRRKMLILTHRQALRFTKTLQFSDDNIFSVC